VLPAGVVAVRIPQKRVVLLAAFEDDAESWRLSRLARPIDRVQADGQRREAVSLSESLDEVVVDRVEARLPLPRW
jgi:hypothetical protein